MSTSMHDVGREIASAQERALEARGSSVDEVRRRLFLEKRPAPPARSHGRQFGLALAAAALLATGLVQTTRRSVHVDSLVAGARVESTSTERGSTGDATVRFELAPGSRLRSLANEPARTTLALEEGSAFFDVVHRDRAEVVVVAGPHRVRVVGTRFRVRWNATRAEGRVEVDRGRVEVTSPGRAVAALGAGQSIRLVTPAPTREATGARDSTSAASGAREAPDDLRDDQATRERAAATVRSRDVTSDGLARFRSLVASARYHEAILLLGAPGVGRVTQQGAREDLVRLSDALRLLRDPRAESALLALRARFPGTDDASTAAFQLGRLEGESDAAARYLATYLEERPRGRFRAEARGRLLRIAVRARDEARARVLAREYLADQPDGPYAPLAREALGGAQ